MEKNNTILTEEQYALFKGMVEATYDNLVEFKATSQMGHTILGNLLASFHRYWGLPRDPQVMNTLVELSRAIVERHVLVKTLGKGGQNN